MSGSLVPPPAGFAVALLDRLGLGDRNVLAIAIAMILAVCALYIAGRMMRTRARRHERRG